jgi:hypothetical protein
VAGTGDRDIFESGVEQVRVDAGVSIDQDALGRQPLRAVTGNGVAVIEVTMFNRIEVDFAAVIEKG